MNYADSEYFLSAIWGTGDLVSHSTPKNRRAVRLKLKGRFSSAYFLKINMLNAI